MVPRIEFRKCPKAALPRRSLSVPFLWATGFLWSVSVLGAESTLPSSDASAPAASARHASSSARLPDERQGLDRAKLRQVSARLARGYYQALINAEFTQAAGFLHPEFLAQMKKSWLQRVEAARPPARKKQLAAMGLKTLSEATLLSGVTFFSRYAASPQGAGLRRLSEPGLLQMRAVVENQMCDPKEQSCQVQLRIKGRKDNGEKISAPQTLWVRFAEGKFWVDSRAPGKSGR